MSRKQKNCIKEWFRLKAVRYTLYWLVSAESEILRLTKAPKISSVPLQSKNHSLKSWIQPSPNFQSKLNIFNYFYTYRNQSKPSIIYLISNEYFVAHTAFKLDRRFFIKLSETNEAKGGKGVYDWGRKWESDTKKYSFINKSLNSHLKMLVINNIFYYQSTFHHGTRYSSPHSWSIKTNPQT